MDKRTFVGLCAALAFVAGSPGAYAIKIFNEAPGDRMVLMGGMDSFTYAAETLLGGDVHVQEVEGDSTKYYVINGGGVDGALVLSAPADVGATSGSAYTVAVTMNGMVFRSIASLAATGGDGTPPTFGVIAGGAAGDKRVVFQLQSGSVTSTEAVLNVTAGFAVSEGGGSAKLTMTNQSLADLNIEGVTGTSVHSGNPIKVAPALTETAMTNDLTAAVVDSFKKFAGGMTVGHVGSITVGFNAHRIATERGGAAVTDLKDFLDLALDGEAPNSSISFMGDFSFTEKVYVHGDNDCGAADPGNNQAGGAGADEDLASAEDDIRNMEGDGDDAVVTNTTKAVNLDNENPADQNDPNVSSVHYLCIMVQGVDREGEDGMDAPRIPDTDAYTVMGSYDGIEDAAIGPKPMERMLGEIDRDGTTIRFPFLTSQARYNQVLRITNRGSNPARYEFSSSEMDGVIEDSLMGGGMTTRLLVRDLIGDGVGEASGTLIIEAQPKHIDVALVHVNRDDSSTDTWIYATD